jgi:hypothetical protein
MTRLASIAIAALLLALVAAAPAAAKVGFKSCGPYAKNDGSLADGIVTGVKVLRTSCPGAQKIAGRYTGQVGSFNTTGFACLAYQGSPSQTGLVQCRKRREVIRYNTATLTDCSTSPGINVPASTGTPISGPWTYNTDCATAVTVVNAATVGPGPSGWTCQDNSSTVATGGYCNMPSGTTYMVVQWNDNVQAP